MLINEKNHLCQFTEIRDAEGKLVPFSWIDTDKRTGLEVYLELIGDHYEEVHRADGSIATLEWTEDNPFPYDILVKDAITKKTFTNPCNHDLEDLLKKAAKLSQMVMMEQELERDLMIASSREDEEWKEQNR